VIVDLKPLNFTYFYLFILLMTSHDVMCVSEFVVFKNVVIFLLLFDKTAKLQLSIMIWVE